MSSLFYDCNSMNCGFSDEFWFVFSMSITIGSGSGVGGPQRPGLVDDDIREMITTQVTILGRRSQRFLGQLRPR